MQGLGLGQNLWNNLSNEKRIWDLELGKWGVSVHQVTEDNCKRIGKV